MTTLKASANAAGKAPLRLLNAMANRIRMQLRLKKPKRKSKPRHHLRSRQQRSRLPPKLLPLPQRLPRRYERELLVLEPTHTIIRFGASLVVAQASFTGAKKAAAAPAKAAPAAAAVASSSGKWPAKVTRVPVCGNRASLAHTYIHQNRCLPLTCRKRGTRASPKRLAT